MSSIEIVLSRISDLIINCKFFAVIEVLFSIKMDFFIIIGLLISYDGIEVM